MPGGMLLLGVTPNTNGWNHNGAPKSVKANTLINTLAQVLINICWLPCWRIYYFKTKLSLKTKNKFARTTTWIYNGVSQEHTCDYHRWHASDITSKAHQIHLTLMLLSEKMKWATRTITEHSHHTEPIISSGIIPQRAPRYTPNLYLGWRLVAHDMREELAIRQNVWPCEHHGL